MSLPPNDENRSSAGPSAPPGRIGASIPTGTVLAATLDHMNRSATLAMFQTLIEELDTHCERERTRGRHVWLAVLILALLLSGLSFLVGYLLAGRRAAPFCPPLPAIVTCANPPQAQTTQEAIPPTPPASPAQRPECFQMALAQGRSPPEPTKPVAERPDFEMEATKPKTAAAISKSVALPKELAGLYLRPGSMEEELVAFLTRDGAKPPRTFTLDRVKSARNSHEVPPEGREQVQALARILHGFPAVHIEIRGHIDSTESEVYTGPNPVPGYSLSQIRADCVLKRLQHLNISPDRMRLRGMGTSQPVASEQTEEGRQLNRRIEIVVLPH